MLEYKGVSLALDGTPILKDVSFRLRPGGLTALVGRNGSGKSTLISCLDGGLPYSGTVLLGGEDLKTVPPRRRARLAAVLHQDMPAPRLTVRELAAFGREPYLDFTGRLREQDREAVERAMEAAGVRSLAERRADTLSGGERQRVYLAMILAQETELVVLDEPGAHLDRVWEASFLELLTALEGRTVLLALHDLDAAVRYARDILVLEEGRLVFSGSVEECLGQEVLEKTFRLRRYTAEEGRIFFAP
ncbi:MAG: ABC transporter ATP-binding protein [Clostridia bacterium]|nr:ABC transporter ATP-binding protein [Clostridia bacterium]MBQ6892172.1 ABC transporter ATP-binding protein [Clostridia bacterium]